MKEESGQGSAQPLGENMNTTQVQILLTAYGITRYQITNEHYGNSHDGPLKKLLIWDRFIPDPSEFKALGYDLCFR